VPIADRVSEERERKRKIKIKREEKEAEGDAHGLGRWGADAAP
jgi:hypothetical protein